MTILSSNIKIRLLKGTKAKKTKQDIKKNGRSILYCTLSLSTRNFGEYNGVSFYFSKIAKNDSPRKIV